MIDNLPSAILLMGVIVDEVQLFVSSASTEYGCALLMWKFITNIVNEWMKTRYTDRIRRKKRNFQRNRNMLQNHVNNSIILVSSNQRRSHMYMQWCICLLFLRTDRRLGAHGETTAEKISRSVVRPKMRWIYCVFPHEDQRSLLFSTFGLALKVGTLVKKCVELTGVCCVIKACVFPGEANYIIACSRKWREYASFCATHSPPFRRAHSLHIERCVPWSLHDALRWITKRCQVR